MASRRAPLHHRRFGVISAFRPRLSIRLNLEIETHRRRARERLDSILNLVGTQMSEWATKLTLEYSKLPLRIDLGRLNVVTDTPDGPVPMDRMGGGENWVGYHLLAHLALHRWFVQHKRPVPLRMPSCRLFSMKTGWRSRACSICF